MKNKRAICVAMSCAMLLTTSIFSNGLSVHAAETTNFSDGTDLNITAEATTMNVTIPGELPIIFNANGTNTIPDNFTIQNNSKLSGVELKCINFDSEGTEWKFGNSGFNTKTDGKDSKNIKFYAGKDGELKLAEGGTELSTTSAIQFNNFQIPAEQTQNLKFNVERGAYTQNLGLAKAFKMNFNFDWIGNDSTILGVETKGTLLKGSDFNKNIPLDTTNIIFTDEKLPEGAINPIDISIEQNGSIMAWTDPGTTTWKVSTQIKNGLINANSNCQDMLSGMSRKNWSYMPIKHIDLKYLNTSNVTDMWGMFSKNKYLEELDITNLNTSKVTRMKGMFSNNEKIKHLNLSNFDTSNVTDMSDMFAGCYELKYLDVSNFNTSNVTNMSNMFGLCYNIEYIKGLENFNTFNVTNMYNMFTKLHKIKELNLSSFNTQNVNNMDYMFKESENLKTIYIDDGWNIDNLNYGGSEQMFYNCTSIVGQSGVTYDLSKTDSTMANWETGYLTHINQKPAA